ncbi:MAG: LysR substrate-binding domain-containing protein, partial [Casimicrobiaceae bacterium]
MRGHLPAINELAAFDAVARRLSITAAGRDLHLTQSAVSRQIASLESCLGTRLFRRDAGRLRLTAAGERFLASIRPALATIRTATREAGSDLAAARLNVAAAPTFATQWLLPRLGRFRAAHPGLTLDFVAHTPTLDFSQPGDLDVAIQFGDGAFPYAQAHYLIGRDVVVICHPGRAAGGRLRSPADLAGLILLQHVEAPDAWRAWLDAQPPTDDASRVATIDATAGPRFPQFALIISAAAQDMGVGLVPRCLIDEPLARGEIAVAIDVPVPARRGHW